MTTLIRAPRLEESFHVLGRVAYNIGGLNQSKTIRTGGTPMLDADHEGDHLGWSQEAGASLGGQAVSAASGGMDFSPAGTKVTMPTVDELKSIFADQITEWRRESMELGQSEGRETGKREVEQQHAERLQQLDQTIAGLQSALDQSIDGLIDVGVDIVYEAVTRILGRTLVDKSGAAAVVREVIRAAKDRSRLLIRVNPSDQAVLLSMRDQLIEGLSTQHAEIVADERVELGGCLLETPAGNLDGRLEVQLQQLRDTLISARLRRPESVIES